MPLLMCGHPQSPVGDLIFNLIFEELNIILKWCAHMLFRDEVVHLPKSASVMASCTSLGFLNSIIYYHSEEGPVCANATSFLLCGMAVMWNLF